MLYDQPGGLFKFFVTFFQVHITYSSDFLFHGLEYHGRGIALLLTDVIGDVFDLRTIYEGTLQADGFTSTEEEHVAPANQLVGSRAIQDGA